jgi:hypothetical protein
MLTACANKSRAMRKMLPSDDELSAHSVRELLAGVYTPFGEWFCGIRCLFTVREDFIGVSII